LRDIRVDVENKVCKVRQNFFQPLLQSIGLKRVPAMADQFYATAKLTDSDYRNEDPCSLFDGLLEKRLYTSIGFIALAHFANDIGVN
jgi:hypothetical protein